MALFVATSAGCTVQDSNLAGGVTTQPVPGPGRGGTTSLRDARNEPGIDDPVPAPPLTPPSDGGPDGSGEPSVDSGAGVDQAPGPPLYAVAEVSTWRGGAQGVYSLIHGSVCDGSAAGSFTLADPELTRRGLRGGFSVIASSCGQGASSQWPRVKALADRGHEIINQSFSFACLGDQAMCPPGVRRTNDFAMEIDQAARAVQENTGATVRYFTFPFDVCGTAALAHLRQRGYLGARCGARGISEPTFPDGFATRYDTWGPTYSIYGVSGPCMGMVAPNAATPPESLPAACRRYVLDQYVDDAITQKGWAIRTLTGFLGDPLAFQPVSPADYIAHLDHLKEKVDAGLLWVEGPTAVLKYRFARGSCPRPTVQGDTLRFPSPSPECQTYATALSYVVTAVTAAVPDTLTVTQAGIAQPAKTLGRGRYLVNADPTQGDAVLTTP